MEPILQFFNGGSMDSLFIGTLGTILTITGVITTLVLPIASDRSKSKKRKPIVLVCEIGTLVGLVLIITGHTVGLQILMACCLGIFLTGVTPIVMVLGYESAYPVSEGTTESDAAGRQWLGPHLPAGCKRHLSWEPYGHSGVLPCPHRPFPGPYHDDKGSLPQGTPHRMTGPAAPNPIFSLAPPFPSGMAEPFSVVPRQIPIKPAPFSLTARLWCGRILR